MSISYRSREVPAVLIEPTYRRIRLKLGEEVIADSTQAIVVYENGGHPVYYLPKSDFRADLLQPSEKTGASPVLGARRYWSLKGAEGSGWSYENVP
ncbi:DUF427 domain-containing protein, partial [Escherichia coli]|uniref:DUF427 domain-containing protein n=2 Tax=Pseudomonadota TaxID=1224 RepID=UPI003D07B6EF